MSALGFDSSRSMGHHPNMDILLENKRIRQENLNARNKHIDNISKAKDNVTALGTTNANVTTVGETVLGQTAGKGKDIEATAKTIGSLPKIASEVSDLTEKYVIGGLDSASDIVNQGVRNIVGARTGGTPFVKTADSLLKSDKELLAQNPTDFRVADRVARATERGSSVLGDAKGFLKAGVSTGETIAERGASVGKLGLAGAGLSVGLGLMDTAEDISAGKIVGQNSAERVSNVAGMVSGGLEAVGTALDLTGVGAPVGVALNILGGIAGLVGGGAELIGEDKEKKDAQDKVKAVQKIAPKQQKQIAFQDSGSSGAEVKSNY